jgi:DNA repair protein RadA/Sms
MATQCIHCRAKMAPGKYRCERCKQWNLGPGSGEDDGTVLLGDVPEQPVPRLRTGPWDVNFGDPPGLPSGSVVLLGGEPGVGKSTIALQWSAAIAMAPENTKELPVLYLGAEENAAQVKMRAARLNLPGLLTRVRILPLERMQDASLDRLIARPLAGMVVDSIPGFTQDPERAVELVGVFKQAATAKGSITSPKGAIRQAS